MIPKQTIEQRQEKHQQQWEHQAITKEYMSAVNPPMPKIDVIGFPAEMHLSGDTRIIPLDLSKSLKTKYPATTPNLMANYLKICQGKTLKTDVNATSQMFYIIRGSGRTQTPVGTINWKEGDLLV